jgi:hypothetical protein
VAHYREVPDAEESDGEWEQGDGHGYGEGGFLGAGAFEELERDGPEVTNQDVRKRKRTPGTRM